MVLIDSRAGSFCIESPLRQLGIPCELTTLEYGDCAFIGNGPTGLITIAVERKTLSDLISSMRQGRLTGHQLIGLSQQYQVLYLLVEGIYSPSFDGSGTIMELTDKNYWRAPIQQASVRYREVDSFLITLQQKCGVIILRSSHLWESAHIIGDLARWWSKDWDEHTGHLGMHAPKFMPVDEAGHVLLTKASLLRRVAKELDGVGVTRSKAVEEHFGSVENMVSAEEKEWMEIEGIGKVTAKKIVAEIRKGH